VPMLAFATAAQCQMACCRKAANASCHRTHSHSGPGFQSAPCLSSCANVQVGMTPVVTPPAVPVVLPDIVMAEHSFIVLPDSHASRLRGVSLLPRPPPTFLQ